MTRPRVLAIFLDGYEQSLGAELMAAGEMPALARLRDQSARFLLDHGAAQRTGLAGEHVSTGLSPQAAGRWAAVSFDAASYRVWQEGTSREPFASRLKARTVVFDATYFDLQSASGVRGVVGWGAHDPGVSRSARPAELADEFEARFGSYPAERWLYSFVWPSAELSARTGRELAAGAALRARAARWLLKERLPDWDLALVGVGEPHSVIEALWHGIDPAHPLRDLPSAKPAGAGVRAVYRAVDALVGDLADAFGDATKIVFATGGMGTNQSDVPSMVLLPELLYRSAFGRPLLKLPAEWRDAGNGCPVLGEDEEWHAAMQALYAPPTAHLTRLGRARRRLRRFVSALRGRRDRWRRRDRRPGPVRSSLGWMPATRYQPYWRRMPAFALPSFYDGRIRINLAGRERHGVVPFDRYKKACDEVEALLHSCVNPATGEGVVDFIERFDGADPTALDATGSDLVVAWRDTAVAFDHPSLGRIGPVPFRRTGGHTGPFGMAFVSGCGIEAGDRGVRSSFDVVPTIIDLLGEPLPAGLGGASMLGEEGHGERSDRK